jgi:hypothetical protein
MALLEIVPRAPDQATIQVDSLGERVGFAGRGDESHLTELGLEAGTRYARRVRDDIERPTNILFSRESQDVYTHG